MPKWQEGQRTGPYRTGLKIVNASRLDFEEMAFSATKQLYEPLHIITAIKRNFAKPVTK
jgi:hypothetical protein